MKNSDHETVSSEQKALPVTREEITALYAYRNEVLIDSLKLDAMIDFDKSAIDSGSLFDEMTMLENRALGNIAMREALALGSVDPIVAIYAANADKYEEAVRESFTRYRAALDRHKNMVSVAMGMTAKKKEARQ